MPHVITEEKIEQFIYMHDTEEDFHNSIARAISLGLIEGKAIPSKSTLAMVVTIYHFLKAHKADIPWLTLRKHLASILLILREDREDGFSACINSMFRYIDKEL